MQAEHLHEITVQSLEDLKARDITTLNLAENNSYTDYIVIATGNSTRHVKSMAQELVTQAKKQGVPPIGVEGEADGDWVLVDLGSVVVHLMLEQTRAYYQIEKIWQAKPEDLPH